VLKEHDAAGLPMAGPTTASDDDGAPIWVARQLWPEEDYDLNIQTHLDIRNENHLVATKLADEKFARHGGVRFPIPDLP